MRFYFYRTPTILKKVLQGCTWNRPSTEKVIYLTFDDGPVPDATEWVLEILGHYHAKATFFMVGQNIEKYPQVFQKVLDEGHSVGNHTYNHIKGWNTTSVDYIVNTDACQTLIDSHVGELNKKPLFRPPYGRITKKQVRELSQKYEVVMWQLLSGDFDLSLNQDASWRALSKTRSGDIVVFHDSQKYMKNVKAILPKYLAHFTRMGFSFKQL